MQKNTKSFPDKKAMSLEIKNQLTQSLSHLKELWGEKKFNNKIDEAVKIFTKGFKKLEHSKDSVKKEKKQEAVTPKTTTEKTVKKEDVKKKGSEVAAEAVSAPKKQSSQRSVRKSSAKS